MKSERATLRTGLVVSIASDAMGEGADELGVLLMKSFCYALTKQESLPDALVLYNRGALLATEGADTLEDLRVLADKGVEILVCGTCLSFFEKTEQLAVGIMSNMYDIVQKQCEAETVVRP